MSASSITINNCYTANHGAAINLISTSATKTFSLVTSSFSGNAALYGGAIYCDACLWTLQENTFINNRAYQAGDIYIKDPQADITLDSHSHYNSQAYSQGGAIYYYETDSLTAVIFTVELTTGI